MSNVTLDIAGRRYTIACAEGEEGHIKKLGASIDGKLRNMDNLSSQSEARTLLFAALLLADELHEADAKSDGAAATAAAVIPPAFDDAEMAETFEKMAERLESIASNLEGEATST